jgi:DNA modification methylase/uncharacterized ParB-like nuclease family protein
MSKSTEKKRPQGLAIPQVEVFAVADLVAAADNPRIISEAALAGLTQSISRFGCVEPIVVNVQGGGKRIVGGHQRLKALLQLGVEKVLCVTVRCTPAEEKLLNVTLNNPEIQGRFVAELDAYITKLREELADPSVLRDLRIDELYAGIAKPSEKQGKVPDDDLPPRPKTAVTRPGDLWLLGEHRLLCGDSTCPEDVARLMADNKAKLLATDPPYCVKYTGKDRPGGGRNWTGVYQESDDVTKLYEAFYRVGLEHVEPASPLYLWHADRRRSQIEQLCQGLSLHIHQTIVWVKPCCVLGYSYYAMRHEPCLLMWQSKHKPPIGHDARRITNAVTAVWPVGYQKTGDPTTPEYYSDIWELDWGGKKRPSGIEHPTVKPVEVFAIPMRIHTRPGDICYEPFSGSGTQIIAAEKLQRRCFAIEKQPLFVDVAVRRWQEWSGQKATLEKKRHRGR